MGICFIGEKRRFTEFLSDYMPSQPGAIRELGSGRELGSHQGLWMYTIGQNAKIAGMSERMFVVRKNRVTNEIWVAPTNSSALLASSLVSHDFSWIWADSPPDALNTPNGFRAHVQVRHRMPEVGCTVFSDSNGVRIVFDEPQKAVAEGQIAALWDGEWCLGCGTIDHVACLDG